MTGTQPPGPDALSRSDLIEQVLDAISDAVLVVDSAGRIHAVNARVREVFGYEPDALVGRQVESLIPQPLRDAHESHRSEFAENPQARVMGARQHLTALRADGTELPVNVSLSPMPSPAGPLTVAVVRDLSERRAWEASDQELARSVLDGALDAYVAADRAGVIEWNRAAETLFGWSREEALGKAPADLLAPSNLREELAGQWREFARTGVSHRAGQVFELAARRRDGTEIQIEVAVTLTGEGADTRAHVFARDIGERKEHEERAALAATILTSSQDGIWALDPSGIVTVWNPAIAQLWDIPVEQAIGRPLDSLFPPSAMVQLRPLIDAALAGHKSSFLAPRRRADGTEFTVSGRLAPIIDPAGEITGVFADIRDLTDQERAQKSARDTLLQLQSIIDNSSAAISVRDREFRFVLANRAFAELAGLPSDEAVAGRPDSEVLGSAAVSHLRVGDRLVLGGEPVTREETLTRAGEERTLLSQRFPLADDQGNVYAIGEVASDITDRKHAELELLERIAWEEHISRAVNESRLLVYAQPIIELDTGALWGEELLVRMQGGHGPDDVVLPADFLPQAERFGLMPVIDRFMCAEAIRLARQGRRISVNLSATSIQSTAWVDEIIARLGAAGPAAASLTFEITETAALAAPAVAQDFSVRLAELGAGLALDDFGTGYGSFTELRSLKPRILKIDTSFVGNLATTDEDQRVVKLIIHIAREFGITTTAEGVEDAQALAMLREFGADRAQGFFIARPAPVEP